MIPVELPDFEAEWRPLRMETIPGSGEVMTVAILVRAASGQSSIRQSVQPSVFASLFGPSAGKGIGTMVTESVLSIQRQLDAGTPTEQLEPPFGGFDLGPVRDCAARDINDVFDIAIRLSSAFGQSAFGQAAEASDSTKRAFDDWADRVKVALLRKQEVDLATDALRDFNVRLKVGGKQMRFGLLRHTYAANFGVLRPGHTSGDIRSLKVKVFDLQGLRREQVLPIDTAEIVVGCPTENMLEPFSRREIETFQESLTFIDLESKARGVRLVRCETADKAAHHIASALMAA